MKSFNIVLLFLLILASTTLYAQAMKFGHINAQSLLQLMPERDSAEAKLKVYATELEEQMEAVQVEYNNKLNVYQQKRAGWSAAVVELREKELVSLQQRIQETQVALQQEYQKQQSDLLRPILDKLNNAIQKVGKDGGFIYIFDTSNGTVIYSDPAQSVDVTNLVKKILNITKDTPTLSTPTPPARR